MPHLAHQSLSTHTSVRSATRPEFFPLSIESEVFRVDLPSGGEPHLVSSVAELSVAAEALARGTGPIAIDTERASSFRYDDRAFIIQIRRAKTGTVVIDAEALRSHIEILAPTLNSQEWVVHSAKTDLPCLDELGLRPRSLFDTELCGRMCGFEKVNLAAMIEATVGAQMSKSHGAEDWSKRPLPRSWINYAALDVEYLLEMSRVLASLLSELGRTAWLKQECDHIREVCRLEGQKTHSAQMRWQKSKGLGNLRSSEQLAAFRGLWMQRDEVALKLDVSPHRILHTRSLLEIAENPPRSSSQLRRNPAFPHKRFADVWFSSIKHSQRANFAVNTDTPQFILSALQDSRFSTVSAPEPAFSQSLFTLDGQFSSVHSKRALALSPLLLSGDPARRIKLLRSYRGTKYFPRGDCKAQAERYCLALMAAMSELEGEVGIERHVILEPINIRYLSWALAVNDAFIKRSAHNDAHSRNPLTHAEHIDMLFTSLGARPWQRELAVTPCAAALNTLLSEGNLLS